MQVEKMDTKPVITKFNDVQIQEQYNCGRLPQQLISQFVCASLTLQAIPTTAALSCTSTVAPGAQSKICPKCPQWTHSTCSHTYMQNVLRVHPPTHFIDNRWQCFYDQHSPYKSHPSSCQSTTQCKSCCKCSLQSSPHLPQRWVQADQRAVVRFHYRFLGLPRCDRKMEGNWSPFPAKYQLGESEAGTRWDL